MKRLLKILRTAREEKGLSQEYLSCKLKVSSSTISRWEMGVTEMTIQQIKCYADAVEIDITQIFACLANEDGPPSPIAEIQVHVFSKEAYDKITETICSLGFENATIMTKRLLVWK